MPTCVPVVSGKASLGAWGTLELTGRESALVRSSMGDDFAVPRSVAAELPQGVAVLSNELGRLLFLPYAGNEAVCIDLVAGGLLYPPVQLDRVVEHGLRTASVRILAGKGVLYLTEAGLCLFDESLRLSWSHEDDFLGWSMEDLIDDEVVLLFSDWTGRESRQVFSLTDGRLVRVAKSPE